MNNLNPLYEGIIGKIFKYSIKKGYQKGKEGIQTIRCKMDKDYKKELKKLKSSDTPIDDEDVSDDNSELDFTDYVMF